MARGINVALEGIALEINVYLHNKGAKRRLWNEVHFEVAFPPLRPSAPKNNYDLRSPVGSTGGWAFLLNKHMWE